MHLPQGLSLLLVLLLLLLFLGDLLLSASQLGLGRQPLDLLGGQLRLELVLRELVLLDPEVFVADVEGDVEALDLLAVLARVVALQVLKQVLSALVLAFLLKLALESLEALEVLAAEVLLWRVTLEHRGAWVAVSGGTLIPSELVIVLHG